MSILDVQNLSIRYGGAPVLHNVSFSVAAGEIITIVGPNGSGKSSLLKALIGAVPLSSGHITKPANLTIGYVPQKLHIDPTLPLTVRRFLSAPRAADAARIEQAVTKTGLKGVLNRQMSALSGGQLQRVLLARAILHAPQIMMLDEATQGLDQPAAAGFYELIEKLRDETGCAILMVSHDLHVVMSASDRVICLNGHICCEGTPEVVTAAPAYRELFGTGTRGTLALYRHEHTHDHSDMGA